MINFRRAFIFVFILSSLVLVVAYLAGESERRDGGESDEELWTESIEQLKAICRDKYRQRLHHIAYAHYAERDSLHAAASLFHAIAHAEGVQCDNCRQAIEGLGGRFHYPTTIATRFFDTPTHLHHTLQHKHHMHLKLIPLAVEQALKDENRYVARMLTWCDASDAKQIWLLQRLVSSPGGEQLARYRICPTCGDISWSEIGSRHCPHCMTDSVQFVIVSYPFKR